MNPTTELSERTAAAAVALGDDALVLSHRLGEWAGHAPVLEEEVELRRLLEQAYESFGEEARRRGIEYECSLEADPVLDTDGDRVLQIVSNLLDNAFAWTPDGGRIDLGLGRAPGSDMATARALRRNLSGDVDQFPQDVVELMHYFEEPEPGQQVQAVPGAGLDVPIWILGSSLFGSRLAATFGLPYAFASHFAPAALDDALALYRREFKPSARLDRPFTIAALNVVAAETDVEARRLFTSLQMAFTDLLRGARGLQKPPIDDIDAYWTPAEKLVATRVCARTWARRWSSTASSTRPWVRRSAP